MEPVTKYTHYPLLFPNLTDVGGVVSSSDIRRLQEREKPTSQPFKLFPYVPVTDCTHVA